MQAILYLIRHGQSQWNLENRFTGWKDIDLSPIGVEEAIKAGKQLKGKKIDVAFTSTLIRAQHTLDIVLKECGLKDIPVFKNAALNERAYGNLEGLNKAETAKKYGDEQVHIWRRSFDVAPPGGESLKDTYNRVIPYFVNTILPYLKALEMFLENLSPEEIVKKEIATGVPMKYQLDDQFISSLYFEPIK